MSPIFFTVSNQPIFALDWPTTFCGKMNEWFWRTISKLNIPNSGLYLVFKIGKKWINACSTMPCLDLCFLTFFATTLPKQNLKFKKSKSWGSFHYFSVSVWLSRHLPLSLDWVKLHKFWLPHPATCLGTISPELVPRSFERPQSMDGNHGLWWCGRSPDWGEETNDQ